MNIQSLRMKDEKQTKGYPQKFHLKQTLMVISFNEEESIDLISVGYHEIDNRWIAPYDSYQSLKLDALINIEVYSTIKSVKYLYVFKGLDCASVCFLINEEGQKKLTLDETNIFLNCRNVSRPESMK